MNLEWTLIALIYAIVMISIWTNQRQQRATHTRTNRRLTEVEAQLNEAQEVIDRARYRLDSMLESNPELIPAPRLLLLTRNDLDVTYTSKPRFDRARIRQTGSPQ